MKRFTLISLCLGLFCIPAWAAPTIGETAQVTYLNVASGTSIGITTSGGSFLYPVQAGLLNINVDGTVYNAFCIDPYQWAYGFEITYDVESLYDALGDKSTAISNILSHVSEIDTAQKATMMQLAIWEVIIDDDFNLSDGTFKANTSSLDPSLVTLAQSFLVSAATGSNYDYLALTNSSIFGEPSYKIRCTCPIGGQDYVIWCPTAVPAPGAILMAGLGLLLAARMKKNRHI